MLRVWDQNYIALNKKYSFVTLDIWSDRLLCKKIIIEKLLHAIKFSVGTATIKIKKKQQKTTKKNQQQIVLTFFYDFNSIIKIFKKKTTFANFPPFVKRHKSHFIIRKTYEEI